MSDIKIKDKHYLVYRGTDFIMAGYASGNIGSHDTIETFATSQDLVDRGVELGVTFDVYCMLDALEDGSTFPEDEMNYLLSIVWDSGEGNVKRMEALGYTNPN